MSPTHFYARPLQENIDVSGFNKFEEKKKMHVEKRKQTLRSMFKKAPSPGETNVLQIVTKCQIYHTVCNLHIRETHIF